MRKQDLIIAAIIIGAAAFFYILYRCVAWYGTSRFKARTPKFPGVMVTSKHFLEKDDVTKDGKVIEKKQILYWIVSKSFRFKKFEHFKRVQGEILSFKVAISKKEFEQFIVDQNGNIVGPKKVWLVPDAIISSFSEREVIRHRISFAKVSMKEYHESLQEVRDKAHSLVWEKKPPEDFEMLAQVAKVVEINTKTA